MRSQIINTITKSFVIEFKNTIPIRILNCIYYDNHPPIINKVV